MFSFACFLCYILPKSPANLAFCNPAELTQVASTSAAAAPVTSWQQLPADLRNATAVLEAPNPAAPGGVTKVFVLGVSHVSQVCSPLQLQPLLIL
jgi:hypothetical protein